MCLFSTAIHKQLQTEKFYKRFDLPSSEALEYHSYCSKNECEKAKKKCIQKVYNTANKYITPNEKLCIANLCATYYSQALYSCLTPILDALKMYCIANQKEIIFQRIIELMKNSQKTFLELFEKELLIHCDYYALYNFDYFLEQVEVEKQDYRVFEESWIRLLETMTPGSIEYTFENAYSAVLEMEKDLNDHCATFFNYAYQEYTNYTEQIELLIVSFGSTFTDFKETDTINEYLIHHSQN